MILKLLLVVAVISVVYFMFIKKKPQKNVNNSSSKDSLEADDMVECAECGVYSQLSDSILSGSKYYCSQECLKKAS
jgi:uncharacterized protein